MTPQKRVLTCSMLLVPAILAVGLYCWCFSGRPNACSFARIHAGMTLEEVERILGPGAEVQGDGIPQFGQKRFAGNKWTQRVVEGDRFYKWPVSKDEIIWISFENNMVLEKKLLSLPLF